MDTNALSLLVEIVDTGNLSQAARLLGLNRTTLYSRIQRLNGAGP